MAMIDPTPGQPPSDPFPAPARPPQPPEQTPNEPVNIPQPGPDVIAPGDEPVGIPSAPDIMPPIEPPNVL
jgi:hypothetical protein